jgi:sulfofructose kinase
LLSYAGVADIAAGLRQVARHNDGFLGVTLGAQGFRWLENGELRGVPAPTVEAIDTLAAGDVFHGSLLLCLAEGMGIEQAGRFACAAAALKCTRFGGCAGAPTRDEVAALL